MTQILAQSGLFIVSVVVMALIYGLPTIVVIAIASGIVKGTVEKSRAGLRLGWSTSMFVITFSKLLIALSVLVLAACLWANWAIPSR